MYPHSCNGLHEQQRIRPGWLEHRLAPWKPTDTHLVLTQHAFSYTWLWALKTEHSTLTLYPSVSSLSLFIYVPTHLISQGTYSYAYSPSYITNIHTPAHVLLKKLTALGLKTQFPTICASIQKASETLQHTKLFSVLVCVMEPGATHTHRCSPRAHLGSAFKERTCNWGHKSCSWMNDGLLRQSQPQTPSTWDGCRDGCNRVFTGHSVPAISGSVCLKWIYVQTKCLVCSRIC